MAEHHVATQVNAPVHQVYTLFTHFNDFPKFMRFVKEVTYYDDQRSHWVTQIAGKHEWDAINEDWIPDKQIGWRSINGLENRGKVTFQEMGSNRTLVDVFLYYNPPLGKVGDLAENITVNTHFDEALKQDLDHFAQMVEQTPHNAADPMASRYLFHSGSAVGTDTVTNQQKTSMVQDTMMSKQALREREQAVQQETHATEVAAREEQERRTREAAQQQQAAQSMQENLHRQLEIDRRARASQAAVREQETANTAQGDPEQINADATLGGRGASMPNKALGDMDASTQRYPGYEQDEMMARRVPPADKDRQPGVINPDVEQTEQDSPWRGTNEPAE